MSSSSHVGHASIYGMLRTRAARSPASIALLAPGQDALTNSELLTHVQGVSAIIGAAAATERVGVLMPNGPELGVATLAAASCATCAPINPALRHAELEFEFVDLRITTLLVATDLYEQARSAIDAWGGRVLLTTPTNKAGAFVFVGETRETAPSFAGADRVALLLHTSGTTARPKIVPLLQKHLCASATDIGATLDLGRDDRCLNVMPLFHIHGIVAGMLAPLVSGGSVICMPAFTPPEFFSALQHLRPTWYTAVPTIHQAVLANVARFDIAAQSSLRFIRSSSAALPAPLAEGLERAFGVPVIEAYGMTEAAHQMASNPLPPRQRKIGSVGLPTTTITVLNASGNPVPQGEVGEVCIRGPHVFEGYEANPPANAQAFTNGWFRTGDEGYFDTDGYLFLSGRIKEQINRAGEKISPREVDDVLLSHPDVEQAVTFGLAHPTLGEDVVAAVVLRRGSSVSPEDVRLFVRPRLAEYKTPRQIVLVDAIPTGPSGKLQRRTLAELLQTRLRPSYVAPQTEVERTVARLWAEVLGVDEVGAHDNFFQLGGDSIQAMMVCSRARMAQLRLEPEQFAEQPTLGGLAALAQPIAPSQPNPEEDATGPSPWLPAQLEFVDAAVPLRTSITIQAWRPLNISYLQRAVDHLYSHHDALRIVIERGPEGPRQRITAETNLPVVRTIDLSGTSASDRLEAYTKAIVQVTAQDKVDGPPVTFVYVDCGADGALVIIIASHIVADRRSREILAEDLQTIYDQIAEDRVVALPAKTTSVRRWADHRRQQANAGEFDDDLSYWRALLDSIQPMPTDLPSLQARPCFYRSGIDASQMRHVWDVAYKWGVQPSTIFGAAFAKGLATSFDRRYAALSYIFTGRRDARPPFDLSRTVACLASKVPVVIEIDPAAPGRELTRALQSQLEAILVKGERFAWLVEREPQLRRLLGACAGYNYVSIRRLVAGSERTWCTDSPRLAEIQPEVPAAVNPSDGSSELDALSGIDEPPNVMLECHVRVGVSRTWLFLGGFGLSAPMISRVLRATRTNVMDFCEISHTGAAERLGTRQPIARAATGLSRG